MYANAAGSVPKSWFLSETAVASLAAAVSEDEWKVNDYGFILSHTITYVLFCPATENSYLKKENIMLFLIRFNIPLFSCF